MRDPRHTGYDETGLFGRYEGTYSDSEFYGRIYVVVVLQYVRMMDILCGSSRTR